MRCFFYKKNCGRIHEMGKSLIKPVQYYGGKGGMVKFLLPLFPKKYDVFVDAFGGSGSLLLAEEREKTIEVYNDLGENIYSLYKVIADPEMMKQLQFKLEITPFSEQFRAEFKEDLRRGGLSMVDRAFKYMYVNRTSYNGVGGFSVALAKGRRICKEVSCYLAAVEGLEDLHNRLSSVVIENKDIFKILDRYDRDDTFFYLDPPYIHDTRSSSTKYEVEMTDEEHRRFVERILGMKAKWMLSGYDHPIYEALNGRCRRFETKSPFSDSKRNEVVWLNYGEDD